MNRKEPLTEFEQLILLALVRMGEDRAYGVTVREEIERRAQRSISLAAVYAALERLERRGHISCWVAEATAVRGGRAKKHCKITPAGAAALRATHGVMERMWDGLQAHPDLKTP